ncbi:MAG TPA: L,D-transpeptidase, partial [Armatimonadota bacterium]|nr:L,D-transpeptidase [Armatimonadota bacterium]
MATNESYENRRRPDGVPERRDYTPKGRIRRIIHEYRWSSLTMLLTVLVAGGLFVSTALWAVNERLTRRVTEMTYLKDARSLDFIRQKEVERTREIAEKERQLAAKEEELAPAGKPYIVVSLAERRMLYLKGDDTLYRASVAVGSGKTLVMGGQTKRFITPRGRMSITHKELDPVWVPPNWHYIEIAR